MAEDQGQEKTEEPSEKRLEKFREEGQIARTQELGGLVSITTSMVLLSIYGPQIGKGFAESIRGSFRYSAQGSLFDLIQWVQQYAYPLFRIVLIFSCTLMVVSVATSLFQTGLNFSSKVLEPKFKRVNPFAGLKKFFSPGMLVQLLKNIAKVTVIGSIVYNTVKSRIGEIIALATVPLNEAMIWCGGLLSTIVLKVAVFLAALAAFDYIYQWYTLRKEMMMTRQELKDEYKESQLPDNIRNKVRQVANERAKRTIQKEVPMADVIITNPTHYAVAIRYRRFIDRAPRVVAKGQDLLAAVIRDVGQKNNVPLYEYPELARKLYRTVKVGESIPGDLYEAVARVLAFIYRVYKDRKVVRA